VPQKCEYTPFLMAMAIFMAMMFFLHSKAGESNFRGCQQVNHLQNELVWWINNYIKSKLYITCPLIHYVTHTENISISILQRNTSAFVEVNQLEMISGGYQHTFPD